MEIDGKSWSDEKELMGRVVVLLFPYQYPLLHDHNPFFSALSLPLLVASTNNLQLFLLLGLFAVELWIGKPTYANNTHLEISVIHHKRIIRNKIEKEKQKGSNFQS